MKPESLKRLTVEELVELFEQIGVQQDEAILFDESDKYEELYLDLDEVDKEIRLRGLRARLDLLRLYEHPNMQVRLNAAKRTLAVSPLQARKLLEQISARKDVPQGGDAGMALRALESVCRPGKDTPRGGPRRSLSPRRVSF
jgi:hypothetical protein